MQYIYNLLITLATFYIKVASHFSSKLKLFVSGRKLSFKKIEESISKTDSVIWFHCASLGEFEQGVPVMEQLKKDFPNYKLLVSFFSPSGYEIKKNTPLADCVVYLPLDTKNNAALFLKLAHPKLAVFVKYEIWPNYLFTLKKLKIPTLLISGLFREKQIYFKAYGGFMKRALYCFDHLFVQDENSKKLLKNIGLKNCTVSGDTRFDRVSHQIEQNNYVAFAENFKDDSLCLVCGSTWPEDDEILLPFIQKCAIKVIIAPHKIEREKIETLRNSISKKTILFSEINDQDLKDYDIVIVDTIGLLTKLYDYADIAYVGGAMGKTGLHNILEPATFGIPIIIGKNFENFPEAERLQHLAGLYSIQNAAEFEIITNKLIFDTSFRKKTGLIAEHFINKNTGATAIITSLIKTMKV